MQTRRQILKSLLPLSFLGGMAVSSRAWGKESYPSEIEELLGHMRGFVECLSRRDREALSLYFYSTSRDVRWSLALRCKGQSREDNRKNQLRIVESCLPELVLQERIRNDLDKKWDKTFKSRILELTSANIKNHILTFVA